MIQRATLSTILLYCFIFTVYPQVGINTVTPTTALDVNGDMRIRNVPSTTTEKKILVIDSNGNVLSNETLFPKTFLRVTGGTSISILTLTLLTNWNKIAFNQVVFDENSEYSTTNYEFVAKQAGVYAIYAQYKLTNLLSALDVGLGVFKKISGATTYSLEAEETYSNISVNLGLTSLDVSPPTRHVQTLVKLNAGDAIAFGTRGLLTSLTLLGGARSYFTIYQVR